MKKLFYTFIMLMALVVANAGFAKTGYEVSGVVNINSATKAELIMIPGIGEAKADAIIQLRDQKPFASKEDLLAVQGIGEKILSKLSPYLVLNGQTTIQKVKIDPAANQPQKPVN